MGRAEEQIHLTETRSAHPPKSSSKIILMALVFSSIIMLLFIIQPQPNGINVLLIDLDGPIRYQTNQRFLSVALDSIVIAENFTGFNMTSEKLKIMMKPLQPSYLRIGGTFADRLRFSRGHKFENYTLFAADWDALNELAQNANLTIIFDLNVLQRSASGSWDSQNAEDLIAYSQQKNYDIVWELGNEPNSFKHVYNFELNSSQLAQDFGSLRTVLQKYPFYKNATVVGPDVTNPKLLRDDSGKYLHEFLSNLKPNVIDAITWHHYYFRGPGAHINDFLNPAIFDSLESEIKAIKHVRNEAGFDDTPIWIGETASAYGGGSPEFSDKFIATFIWLDKLGLAARNGIDLVVRQTLFRASYALLDDQYNPNPDWWISVLYKKLVGEKVVEMKVVGNDRLRLYCHCARDNNGYTDKPAIVVFGMNINIATSFVRLQVQPNFNTNDMFDIKQFSIGSHSSILSKEVYLNGEFLKITENGLPEIRSKNYSGNLIALPPHSIGFWLLELKTRPITICA